MSLSQRRITVLALLAILCLVVSLLLSLALLTPRHPGGHSSLPGLDPNGLASYAGSDPNGVACSGATDPNGGCQSNFHGLLASGVELDPHGGAQVAQGCMIDPNGGCLQLATGPGIDPNG